MATLRYIRILNKVIRVHMNRDRQWGLTASSPHYPFSTFIKKLIRAYLTRYPEKFDTWKLKAAANSNLRALIPPTLPVEIPLPEVVAAAYLDFPGVLEYIESTSLPPLE